VGIGGTMMEELGSMITKELDKSIMLSLTRLISKANRMKHEDAEQFFTELLLIHDITKKLTTNYLKDILYSILTIITCHPRKALELKNIIVMLLISETKNSFNKDEEEDDD
jgi:hypothetical protein